MDVSIKWAQPPPWSGSISFLWLPESHFARSIVSRKQVMFQYYLPFRQIKRKSQRASGASRKEKRKPYSLNTNARRHVWQAVSLSFSLLCLHFPKWKVAVHDQHAPGNCCLTPKEMWHFLQIVGCQTWHSRNPSMISGGWWSCLWQRGWNLVILGVPSNPSHFMVLWDICSSPLDLFFEIFCLGNFGSGVKNPVYFWLDFYCVWMLRGICSSQMNLHVLWVFTLVGENKTQSRQCISNCTKT